FGSWQPRAADYVTDLKGALAGGAAGWCWHNGANRAAKDGRPRRSFDLRAKRLFAQLDQEEARALPLLSKVLAEAAPGAAEDDLLTTKMPRRGGVRLTTRWG